MGIYIVVGDMFLGHGGLFLSLRIIVFTVVKLDIEMVELSSSHSWFCYVSSAHTVILSQFTLPLPFPVVPQAPHSTFTNTQLVLLLAKAVVFCFLFFYFYFILFCLLG